MKRTLVVGGVIAVVLAVGFYALAQPKSEDKREMTKSGDNRTGSASCAPDASRARGTRARRRRRSERHTR